MDVTNREIDNLKVTFDILEDVARISVGYDKASINFDFDAHLDLEPKFIWFKDGYMTPEPK